MRRRRSPLAALWLAAAWALLAGARTAGATTWCIVRTGAPVRTVQTALDYACSPAGGADCAPILPSGLCYLPNSLAAHASYAYNSVYQRSRAAPGACDFAGTATVTLTDPSYGSCTYPSSSSTAGTPGSATSTSRPPPRSRNDDDDDGDLGPDDSVAQVQAATFMSLALSCLVYLHLLRWW